ncbi:MAG TPA: hypothetical protein VGQ82_10625 [Chthoniobacterales bacterium]|nr:hypothetical protein [Chthoniobacterales bacterium]
MPADDEGDEVVDGLLRAMLAATIRAYCAAWNSVANERADLVVSEVKPAPQPFPARLCKLHWFAGIGIKI